MDNVILTLDNYSIYRNNDYYICTSNQNANNYQMFISFSIWFIVASLPPKINFIVNNIAYKICCRNK